MPGYHRLGYCQVRRITSADGEVSIFAGKGALVGIGANAVDSTADVDCWDNDGVAATADAQLVAEYQTPATGQVQNIVPLPGAGVRVTNGLVAAVDGTSNVAYIYYRSG